MRTITLLVALLSTLFFCACGAGKVNVPLDGGEDGGADAADGTDADDGGADVDDGGSDADDAGSDADDGSADADDGGADADDGGADVDDGGADVDDGGADVDDGGADANDGGPDGGEDGSDGGTPANCWEQAPPAVEVVAWLDPEGDDDGPGTETTPFQSLETAAVAVRARLLQGDLPAGGIAVMLKGGTYPRSSTFSLGADDSGQDGAPVIWRAAPGETARLSGGVELPAAGFATLQAGDPNYDRIPASARAQVQVIDLPAHGVSDFGTLQDRGWGGSNESALELYFDGVPQRLARWPNQGQTDAVDPEADAVVKGDIFGAGTIFSYIGTVAADNADDGTPNYHGQANGTDWYLYHCTWEWGGATHRYWFISGTDPRVQGACWPSDQTAWAGSGTDPLPVLSTAWGAGTEAVVPSNRPEDHAQDGFLRIPEVYSDTDLRLPGQRHAGWDRSGGIWVQGLFYNYWADDTLAGQVDGAGRVSLAEAPAYGLAARQPFFVFNLPEELDEAGETWLDRATGRLYWWPPAGWQGGRLVVSVLAEPLLRLNGATHLRFDGLGFEAVRGDVIDATGVADLIFSRCRIIGAGDDGLRLNGRDAGVLCSEIAQTGGEGVSLAGGHRADLSPSGLYVEDCDIHHFGRWDRTYNPGVALRGCGHRVEHNHIHQAPHTAILYSGNDHRLAYNEIDHVVLEANDAGAIYTGRDWGYRGTVIEFNFIHHILSVFDGAHGVYLDDAVSGMIVRHNLFAHIHGLATQSGGGRDNLFSHNLMAHLKRGAHSTDRRAQTSNYDFTNGTPDSWNLLGRLHFSHESYEWGAALSYQAEPWASAYPLLAQIPDDWAQIQGSHWQDPEGCVFAQNFIWDSEALFVVGTWGGEGALDSYADIAGNVEGQDPLFVDEANGDYSLDPASPAFAIPGWVAIPLDQIGPR